MASLAKPTAGAPAAVSAGAALPLRGTQLRGVVAWRRPGSPGGAGRLVVRASESEGLGSAADAGGNSVVLEVAALPEEPDTEGIGNAATKARKPSPLQKGGSLSGEAAAGKAPAAATLGKVSPVLFLGEFDDPRWKNGTWDISMFTQDGKTDWDAVIDAGTCPLFNPPPTVFLYNCLLFFEFSFLWLRLLIVGAKALRLHFCSAS